MITKFRAWDSKRKKIGPVCGFYRNIVTIGTYDKGYGADLSKVVLMQSTGLKDNNRKEIYEGDIVKVHRMVPVFKGGGYDGEIEEDLICIVELSSYMPHIYPLEWFLRDVTDDEELENYWSSPGLHEESYEVIGNIYENPELLEK